MDNSKSFNDSHSPKEANELLSSRTPLSDETMAQVSGGDESNAAFYRFSVGEIVYNGRRDPRDFKAPILNRRLTTDGRMAIYEAEFVGRKGDRMARGWFDGRSFVRESEYPRPW